MSKLDRLRCLCAVLAILVISLPAIAAEEKETETPAKAKSGLLGYYAIMAKELKLTAEQKEKLTAAVAARTEALAKWDEANKAKLTEYAEAATKAQASGDAEATRKARAAAKELRDAREAISDSATNTLKSMLTDEQKQSFDGYNLYVGAMVKFAAAKLDKTQKAKAKEFAFAAAKKVTPDIKAKDLAAIKDELAAKISAEVLTTEQRDTMAKAAAERKNKGKDATESEKSSS